MPELPDIVVYLEALQQRIAGRTLQAIRLGTPFLLRSVDPPLAEVEGRQVARLHRIGKRIAIGFDNDVWLVFHLMIAGRLHWKAKPVKPDGRRTLACLDFDSGTLTLSEAGSTKRASLHCVRSQSGLRQFDQGGLEVLETDCDAFVKRLRLENHTLKRALTDPSLFSGIGNAYSDEILHRARLSPATLTQRLSDQDSVRLYGSACLVLQEWTAWLREEAAGKFPEHVTAFRPGMAVHGRFREPCPVCHGKIQRIRYATNETNYCPTCQTGGRLLADRALSRLLGRDWGRSEDP